MKQTFLIVMSALCIYSCKPETQNIDNKQRVSNFIGYLNNAEFNKLDSVLSYNFQVIDDSVSTNRSKFIEEIKKLSGNPIVQIIDIESKNNIVKTKETVTDDFISYLELKPIERIREYHFNDSNQLNSIVVIDLKISPDYFIVQQKFFIWAQKNYPDLFIDMVKKNKNGECINEERRHLLSKLKSIGISELDNITLPSVTPSNVTKTSNNNYIEPSNLFLNSLVVAYDGQNPFPFGENTVTTFINELSATILDSGQKVDLKGWTKEDNVYTLHVDYGGENIKFIFVHIVNEGGKWSALLGQRRNRQIDGIFMYHLVPSLINQPL